MTRRAYTLIEVVLATGILAVILLGAHSAVVVAARAVPSRTVGPSTVVSAGAALDTLADEVSMATSISSRTATSVLFGLPDRDGDGAAETIRYSWSGTAGAPLQREFNGGAPFDALPSVQDFALAYETAAVPLPPVYSAAEASLFAYSAVATSPGSVQSDKWWAQYFVPTLPAGARSWSITRVTIVARRRSGSTGSAKAQIRPDAAGSPGATVLGEFTVNESSLGSGFGSEDATYNCIAGLTPGRGVWLVLRWISDTEAFDIQYKASGAGAMPLKTSANNGASWSTVPDSQMILTVYGQAWTGAAPSQATVRAVRVRLRAGASPTDALTRTISVLNGPPDP